MTDISLQNAAKGVLTLQAYSPGMPIEELQRKLGIRDVIKLASNENPLGPSDQVRAALAEAVTGGKLSLYPDGSGHRLKQKIAALHDIGSDRITLGNGSNDIIELLGRVFLGEGRAALYSAHAFAVYELIAKAQGARAVVAPARPDTDPQPYGHDLNAFSTLLAANPDIALVFIANPNNPTGTVLAAQDIQAFLERTPGHVVVALDEAYYEYVDPALRGDVRGWLDRYPNLVVFRTFSKAYGLAGLRVGYSLSSAALADVLNRVRQPFNNNGLALLAAEVALDDAGHLHRSVELNTRERARLAQALAAMGLLVLPSQANFLAIGFGRDAAPINQALLEQGVIVRPIGGGYGLPQFLRVSIGTEVENDRFIAALQKALRA